MLPHPDAAGCAIGDDFSGQELYGTHRFILIEGDIGCLQLVGWLGPV
jgi:hypothetical protein